MKALLSGLFLLAVAGVVVAQTAVPQATLPASGMPPTSGQLQGQSYGLYGRTQPQTLNGTGQSPAGGAVVQTYSVPAAAGSNCCPSTNCGLVASCCQPCPTCERVPSTRTIKHVAYCMTCEPFCVPVCSCCFGHLFSCGSCANCAGPFPRYYLVKRVHNEECPTTKCVPSTCPACGGCGAPQSR
jgi:hypothetical protein